MQLASAGRRRSALRRSDRRNGRILPIRWQRRRSIPDTMTDMTVGIPVIDAGINAIHHRAHSTTTYGRIAQLLPAETGDLELILGRKKFSNQ